MQEFSSTNSRKSQLNGNANLRPIHNSREKAEIELPESAEPRKNMSLEDFHAYMPNHAYIFVPTREIWPAKSVNARIAPIAMKDARGEPVPDDEGKPKKMTASAWLDRHRPVEQMTWAPGLPELVHGRLIFDGAWFDQGGATTFNLYRPPQRHYGDPNAAGLWISHVRKAFGADANHIIIGWLAHRVQRPHEKINHALVLGGKQGIGKDSMLEPVKHAIGSWNFAEVSPQNVLGNFNGLLKSVILRVSEARDLGDVDRFKFYDRSKALTAAPPDVLRVNEKNLREHYVPNVTGVIITTNHKTDGIFLPADDRRHFVAWSDLTREGLLERAVALACRGVRSSRPASENLHNTCTMHNSGRPFQRFRRPSDAGDRRGRHLLCWQARFRLPSTQARPFERGLLGPSAGASSIAPTRFIFWGSVFFNSDQRPGWYGIRRRHNTQS